jgi:type I restriction enzyme M protein
LVPFKDDKQITVAFRRCHDLIRNLSHLKPDEAFGEFLKLLLVKIQDEARSDDFEFQILSLGTPPTPESDNETAHRIRQIFKRACDADNEIGDVFRNEDDIAITNECISKIVRELQRYSFQQTSVDQKGRAFETFISGDLRQEFKEFMTPRPVVDAIVTMANPDRQTQILDPCCGSGAFLVNSLGHVAKSIEKGSFSERQKAKYVFDFGHDKLFGFDASANGVCRENCHDHER